MRSASIEVKVAFADLDGMRIVYHTNYIKWFDLARTKLFREAGLPIDRWEDGGIYLPVVSCSCEYLESASFGDDLRVTARVENAEGAVLDLKYEIEKLDAGRIITTGSTRHIFCGQDMKSMKLDQTFPDLYRDLILE